MLGPSISHPVNNIITSFGYREAIKLYPTIVGMEEYERLPAQDHLRDTDEFDDICRFSDFALKQGHESNSKKLADLVKLMYQIKKASDQNRYALTDMEIQSIAKNSIAKNFAQPFQIPANEMVKEFMIEKYERLAFLLFFRGNNLSLQTRKNLIPRLAKFAFEAGVSTDELEEWISNKYKPLNQLAVNIKPSSFRKISNPILNPKASELFKLRPNFFLSLFEKQHSENFPEIVDQAIDHYVSSEAFYNDLRSEAYTENNLEISILKQSEGIFCEQMSRLILDLPKEKRFSVLNCK